MARRKTRKRRNPAGSLMVLNPRRRRRKASASHLRRRRRSNPTHLFRARRRTHRRRRNPGLSMGRGGKILGLPLKGAVSIVAGALAVKAIGNLAAKFIPLPDGPVKKYGLQVGAAVVATMLARKFLGSRMGEAVATGGAVAIVFGLANDYIVPRVPFLGEYDDTWQGPGVNAYLPPAMMGDSNQWDPSMG